MNGVNQCNSRVFFFKEESKTAGIHKQAIKVITGQNYLCMNRFFSDISSRTF